MEAKELLYRAVLDCDLPMLRTLFRISSSSAKLRRLLDEPIFNTFTALQHACMCGNAELVSLLLDQGVDTEALGKDNWTALHVAVWYANDDARILKILLNSFADVLARDSHGCLPIDLARDLQTRRTLVQHMQKRGASDLAEMYSKVQVCTTLHDCNKPKSDPEVRRRHNKSEQKNEWRYSDCIEVDTDDSFDEEDVTGGVEAGTADRKLESSVRFWRSNLAVWASDNAANSSGIKRHSQVSESSISLISDISSTKSRDSGVYCDNEEELDALAASFQEGKSSLSRWQPFDDLSSFSP